MTTGAPVLTGNELRDLRRGLGISDDSFAKYIGVTQKYYRKAERSGDSPIDVEEFKGFLEKLVEVSPHMIIAKMQTMHKIAEMLKVLGTKLKRTEKWLEFEKRGGQPKEAEVEEEEQEARALSNGGLDKRTVHEE